MWLKYSEQCLEPCSTCINYYYHVILKLKRQYFGNLRQKDNSLEKTLMLGKIEGKRRRRQQGRRWLNNITDSMDMNLSKLQEIMKDKGAWHTVVHGVAKSWTWLSDWSTINQEISKNLRYLCQEPEQRPNIRKKDALSPLLFEKFQRS